MGGVTGRHGRIMARDGEGERVVLDVGSENDALGERVNRRGRRSRTLQLARGQGALADVADVDSAGFRRAAAPHAGMIRVVQILRRVVGNKAVDLVESDGGVGAAGSEALSNVLRHVERRGVAQIADQRRHARIDTDVDTNRIGVVVDVVVEVAVEIAVAVAVQIAVQIGGNLSLGLTLALEAQLALAFALALILILIVRIPEIDTHDVSPLDVKTHPSLRRIADLLRLRSTNDLRQPFTSNKNDLDFDRSGDRFETNDPQKTARRSVPTPIVTKKAHQCPGSAASLSARRSRPSDTAANNYL